MKEFESRHGRVGLESFFHGSELRQDVLSIAGFDLIDRVREAHGKANTEPEGLRAPFGGDPEIVRMALERIDWAREDSRWGAGVITVARRAAR